MRRSLRTLFPVAIAAIAALAVGVPALNGQRAAEAATEPAFPRPGGGPRVIQTYTGLDGGSTYLLDPVRGEYRELGYASIRLAPDGRTVAVEDAVNVRLGVADRTALLRAGGAAVRWLDLPPGSWAWSPDGRALLSSTVDKQTAA